MTPSVLEDLQADTLEFLAQPHESCVTSGRCLSLSGPDFPISKMNTTTTFREAARVSCAMCIFNTSMSWADRPLII